MFVKCLPSIVYRNEKAITIVPHAQPIPTPCIPGAATEIEMSDVYVASYPENQSISLNPVHETQIRALRIQYTFFKLEYFYHRSPLTAAAEEVCWFACWTLNETLPLNGEDIRYWRWGVVGMGYVGHGKTVLGGVLWGGGPIEGGWRGGGGGWVEQHQFQRARGGHAENELWDRGIIG